MNTNVIDNIVEVIREVEQNPSKFVDLCVEIMKRVEEDANEVEIKRECEFASNIVNTLEVSSDKSPLHVILFLDMLTTTYTLKVVRDVEKPHYIFLAGSLLRIGNIITLLEKFTRAILELEEKNDNRDLDPLIINLKGISYKVLSHLYEVASLLGNVVRSMSQVVNSRMVDTLGDIYLPSGKSTVSYYI